MARLDTRSHSAGQSRVPGRESIAGGRSRAIPLQSAGAALQHAVPSAALRFLFVQSRMGLFLVLECQSIRASDFDVRVTPDTDPEQRARDVWFVVAISFELYPVVVLVPTDAPRNALVMGAGNRCRIVSGSASESGAAHWCERHPTDQLRELCLVPLPTLPNSACVSRPGNRRHICIGTRKSDVDSRKLGWSPVPGGAPGGRRVSARSILCRASADFEPSLDDELSRTAAISWRSA